MIRNQLGHFFGFRVAVVLLKSAKYRKVQKEMLLRSKPTDNMTQATQVYDPMSNQESNY